MKANFSCSVPILHTAPPWNVLTVYPCCELQYAISSTITCETFLCYLCSCARSLLCNTAVQFVHEDLLSCQVRHHRSDDAGAPGRSRSMLLPRISVGDGVYEYLLDLRRRAASWQGIDTSMQLRHAHVSPRRRSWRRREVLTARGNTLGYIQTFRDQLQCPFESFRP